MSLPKLKVIGTKLCGDAGQAVQLRGVSTLGFRYPEYFTKESFETFRDEWGADTIRLAMYTDEPGGYCTDGDKEALKHLTKAAARLDKVEMQLDDHNNLAFKEFLKKFLKKTRKISSKMS